ncbi:hypothetical protein [Streptomyces jumonjinensis]
MDRMTIIARTLTGAAVWTVAGLAVSGCVTVTPHPEPLVRGGRPAPALGPQIVQGPAREALEAPVPKRSTPAPPPRPRAAVPERRTPPAAPAPAPAVRRTAAPAPAPTRPRARKPSPPPVSAPLDVCALTETYGGWRPGSAQARLCRQLVGGSRHRP